MSLAAFQASLAALLRCPEAWQPEGDLTPRELTSLLTLASDEEVGKYADERREQRWQSVWRKIPRLGDAAGEQLLYDLWYDGFDAANQLVPSDGTTLAGTYTRAFLAWLAESPDAAAAFTEAGLPAWIHDVVALERAELELTLPVDLGVLRVVELQHDLVTPGEPQARRMLLALVRRGAGRKPRVFEVDETFAAVLRGVTGEGPWEEPSAAALADLEVMGLSEAVQAARRH